MGGVLYVFLYRLLQGGSYNDSIRATMEGFFTMSLQGYDRGCYYGGG